MPTRRTSRAKASGTEGLQTLRWREMDSNSRFLVNTTRTKEGRGTESLQTPRWREKDSNLSYRGTKARNSEASRASRVEDLAFVVDGTPETHPLAGDPSNHFVQVPSSARAGRPP